MELSDRLAAVAQLVTPGYTVADVGTDHGYLPIHLIETGKNHRIIAMDVNDGPLLRAQQHIRSYRLDDVIEIRKSDGFQALAPGEVQSVVVAGMGGGLVIKILSDYPEITRGIEEFVLQPQSEIAKVREYLQQNGFVIVSENMVFEDGKYYPMMRAVHGREAPYTAIEARYGKNLLNERHPVLEQFLRREIEQKSRLSKAVGVHGSAAAMAGRAAIEAELDLCTKALERMTQ